LVMAIDQAVHAPRLCENFRSLCTGERGIGVGRNKLHYKDRQVKMLLPKFCLQVSIPNEYSCFGTYVEDEQLHIPEVSFDRPGLVAIGNHGPNTNSCTFMVMLNEASHLDGHNQIIGRVVRGMEVFRIIEQLPTDRKEKAFVEKNVKTHWGGKPMVDITIADCGVLPEEEVQFQGSSDDGYPECPEDFSCRLEKDPLFGAAEELRLLGNALFKARDFTGALRKYEKATHYLAPLLKRQHQDGIFEEDPREWASGAVVPRDRTDVVRADLTLQLNACQVMLSLKEWRGAIAVADKVLLDLVGKSTKKTNGALPNDPLTVKALFRRARARAALSEAPGEVTQWEEAVEDLRQALRVEPGNKEVEAELKRTEARQRAADQQSSERVYKQMLQAR